MRKLTKVQAVKEFLAAPFKDGTQPRVVDTAELMAFWKVCSAEEKAAFALQSAKNLEAAGAEPAEIVAS